MNHVLRYVSGSAGFAVAAASSGYKASIQGDSQQPVFQTAAEQQAYLKGKLLAEALQQARD